MKRSFSRRIVDFVYDYVLDTNFSGPLFARWHAVISRY